jgi:hypothetical protein
MQTIDFNTTSFDRYGNTTPSGKPWINPALPEPPSHYVRHQVHATFQDDPIALRNIAYTGTDAVLWGNDYPHEEGTYPNSRDIVERLAAKGPVHLSGLKNQVRKQQSDFSEKRFGYGTFLQFVRAARARGFVEMELDADAEDHVLRPAPARPTT